ncbi:hypothetical protein F5144DRAFT_573747 [Chaetomium tenue]|uniref:Uncharacterized protein n=1 Tax=Chaetomium tenue TaxID=1854479 RepID=A0ACB7P813_9PEZI|nr:hypothetical protein F5144DRAFT_573747 [Chaetomium globosum]
MADSAGQPPVAASRSSPSPSFGTGKSTAVDSSGGSTDRLALGTSSGNVEITTNAPSTQQNAGSKPVFKMKRTGFTTLPYGTLAAFPGSRPEPEPAKIISDILPPLIPGFPATPDQSFSNPAPTIHPASAPTSDRLRKTKYANEEERRKATSLALKQRWASGSMDHVHKKRVETLRRRKEAEGLLGAPGITKPSQKTPTSSTRQPRLSDPGSSDLDRKRSGFAEKLAFLFNKPVSSDLADLLAGPRNYRETSDSTSWGDSVASNADVLNDNMEPSNNAMLKKTRPALDSTLNKGNSGDVESEGDSGDSSSASSISNDAKVDDEVSDDDDDEPDNGKEAIAQPIIMAAPDRAYTRWKDENGSLLLTRGVLIPEGYQFSTSTPGHPWVCPVRSCRKVFVKLVQLGSHFIRKHRGAHLHDNEDGTLSERHIGLLRRVGGQASPPKPAIVVSRGPPDPSDPPAVEPSYPPSGPRESAGYVQDVGMGGIIESGLNADTPTSLTADGQGSNREGGGALWSYLQPHLVKHKGPDIPISGWVPQLITLPKVRDLNWNTAWLTTHPFNDTNPRDISALIIQVTGELAPEPCDRCRNGVGPFRSCIMISSKADSGPLSSVFACANCFYHCGQTRCSHKPWGAERASRILDGEVTGNPPIDPLEEMAEDEELSDDSNGDDEGDTNALYDENMEYTMDASNAEMVPVLTQGDAPTGIDEAEPGRLYNMWPGDDGKLIPLYGSLLPAGYQFDTTIPGRPWVCPVRTCRKALCKRADLGFHFQRVHFAACLNDNRDGTFTIKSFYEDKAAGLGKGGRILSHAPPIVVSRDPPARASPIPKPQLPNYLAARAAPVTRAPRNRIPRARLGDTANLWAYIQQHLASTVEIPPSSAVRNLLTLPKQRDVKLNTHRRSRGFIETSSRDVSALIIQVTGDMASEQCKRCRQGKGPFEGCVVASQATHEDTKARYPCCGNCLYGGNKLMCTLLGKNRGRKTRSNKALIGDQSPAVAEPGMLGRSTQQTPTLDNGGPFTRGDAAREKETTVLRSSSHHDAPRPKRPTPSALISQGNLQSQNDLLEMEDWEVAPGRIREATATEPDTIAFSKPYLSATPPQTSVPVCDGAAFRVDTVLAGHALALEADAHKTRLCSVAAGKLRVRIGDEAEFLVGPHGMFKVKAGVRCVVRNGLYLEAVVHTVVLGGGYF